MAIKWYLVRYKALLFVLLFSSLCLCSCIRKGSSSTFEILFIDVGQGDAALVECDGHHMLIDGGDTSAGDKLYRVLEERGIQHLDILAISHLHRDHFGGLPKALTYASKIDLTISNTDHTRTNDKVFRDLEHELGINGATITIPHVGDTYKLGTAKIEVIDNAAEENNDSLVLLITYGKTKFLFTGDIESNAQTRISDRFQNAEDNSYDIDLMKMPHHGAYPQPDGTLYRFLRTFMPKYVVISVGEGNTYKHPDPRTIDLLSGKEYKPTIYRTDKHGDITVKSNGKELSFETSR